jgi:hypothetical protein
LNYSDAAREHWRSTDSLNSSLHHVQGAALEKGTFKGGRGQADEEGGVEIKEDVRSESPQAWS